MIPEIPLPASAVQPSEKEAHAQAAVWGKSLLQLLLEAMELPEEDARGQITQRPRQRLCQPRLPTFSAGFGTRPFAPGAPRYCRHFPKSTFSLSAPTCFSLLQALTVRQAKPSLLVETPDTGRGPDLPPLGFNSPMSSRKKQIHLQKHKEMVFTCSTPSCCAGGAPQVAERRCLRPSGAGHSAQQARRLPPFLSFFPFL